MPLRTLSWFTLQFILTQYLNFMAVSIRYQFHHFCKVDISELYNSERVNRSTTLCYTYEIP